MFNRHHQRCPQNDVFDEQGQPNTGNWSFELGHLLADKKQPLIIYHAHANRSKTLGNFLSKQMNFSKVFDLKDGIENGWIKADKPIIK